MRARIRAHLERLKERFPDLLAGCEVVEFAGTDYPYRCFVDKATWSKVIAALNDEIDYDNFKDEVKRHQGPSGSAYLDALHDVWAEMARLQKRFEAGR